MTVGAPLNSLLERQLRKAAQGQADGHPSIDELCRLVSAHYDALEQERELSSRVMQNVTGRFRQLSERVCDDAGDSRGLLDASPEALLAVDSEGVVQRCNAQARALFRCVAVSLAGKRLIELLEPPAPGDCDSAIESWAQLSSMPGTADDTVGTTLSGETFAAAVKVRATTFAGEPAFLVSVRDVSERHRRELSWGGRLAEQQCFEGLLTAQCDLFIQRRGAAGYADALELLCDYTGADGARLFVFTTDTADRPDLLECIARCGSPGGATGSERILLDTELPWLAAKLSRDAVCQIVDVAALPDDAQREQRWFEAAGIGGLALVPLYAAADAVGFITLESAQPGRAWPGARLQRLPAAVRPLATELRRSRPDAEHAKIAQLLDVTPEIVAISDRAGQLQYVNRSARERLGLDPGADLRDRHLHDLLGAEEASCDEGLKRAIRDGSWQGSVTFSGAKQETASFTQLTTVHRQPGGGIDFFSTVVRDVTAQNEAAERLVRTEQRLRLALAAERDNAAIVLRSITDGVITLDEHGLVIALNPAAEQRFGVQGVDFEGRLVVELFTTAGDDSEQHPVMRCLREGRSIEDGATELVRGPSGEAFAMRYSVVPLRDGSGEVAGAVMVFQDATQERSLYQRLSYQARHDGLTGLANRRELEDRLSERLREAWQPEQQKEHALLYLDIDQFKVVNDTCGHAAGDELLRRIAALMRECIRSGDSLARIGGDEFCVLLADCPLERAECIADNIRTAVSNLRFVWQHHTFNTGVSIGLVRIDRHSESIAAVLSSADVACYAAKDEGRDRVSVYRPDAKSLQHQEMQWVSRLTQACEDDRLTLFQHPIVPLRGAANVSHFELLLRMRDPYGKLVPPNEFIPAAERYNLMPDIDRWVVERALGQYAQSDDGPLRYTLAINLSGASLGDPRFLAFIEAQLSSRRLPPGAVCFEITETAAIGNLDPLIRFMHAMRKKGCQFSLDDFGSGLSSFAYLRDLPVDYLKIDRVFVSRIASNKIDYHMVAAINEVGQVMGIKTVAEGVETVQVLEKLKTTGIDYAQGFLFGKPAEVSGPQVFEPRTSDQIVPLAS